MGKEIMRKKIIGLFVCILLITTILPITAIAGDETDPEISDTTGDARMNVDIQKAWFFEDPATPEYLYITLQVAYLETSYRGTLLHDVYWTMNHVTHFAYAGLGLYMSDVMGKADFVAGAPMVDILGKYHWISRREKQYNNIHYSEVPHWKPAERRHPYQNPRYNITTNPIYVKVRMGRHFHNSDIPNSWITFKVLDGLCTRK